MRPLELKRLLQRPAIATSRGRYAFKTSKNFPSVLAATYSGFVGLTQLEF
ncbi:hypothetical protein F2Q70_00021231 [Brassica cretica]|uniref:Uncharacterized protein n=1 Tax=Brassica cretica TaxID=69181 RepID=A0A8S9GPM3_BRACR|nr:hypothetical protein F2Q70_00021231 [Brassica cretica]